MCACSVVPDSVNPGTIQPTRLLCPSSGIPRQEYWDGLLFPPPGDLPDPGNEPASTAGPALAGRLFTTEPPRKPPDKETDEPP